MLTQKTTARKARRHEWNEARGRRKENIGIVVSNKMDKTVTVKVTRKMRHPQI